MHRKQYKCFAESEVIKNMADGDRHTCDCSCWLDRVCLLGKWLDAETKTEEIYIYIYIHIILKGTTSPPTAADEGRN